MIEREAKEPIRIYLDENEEPFKVAHPPLRFSLSTIPLADGPHTLRVEASNGLAPPTIREIPFRVRNGVAVTVSGLEPGQTIGGQVELIVNAYAGNTEVDFEPRRAETPQPIPTWAWVLSLAVLAWTLFYIVNPARPPRDPAASTFTVDRSLGERLYMDTCARCHGEDGNGRRDAAHPDNYLVKRLRDTPNLAVDETPYKLLFKVVTGVRSPGDVQMPAWGPRLTNEEIVAVVNFVRSSWGHDASQIVPTYRRPPPGIDELEENILDAMVGKDAGKLETCCWPEGVRPQLYRIDGPRWAVGKDDVVAEWGGYFEALGKGEIVDFQLTDVRYAYEPEAVGNIGAYVFAMGRIFLSTRTAEGQDESDTGRFIRVYRRIKRPGVELAAGAPPGSEPPSMWALVFDFASIRMRVGCEVGPSVECPPDERPDTASVAIPGAAVGYAEVQGFFQALQKDPGDAPHERFWTLGYQDFIDLEFPVSWDDVDSVIKLIEVGNSKDSNLVRALRDGRGITVRRPDGTVRRLNIARMPKGATMPDEQVAKIAAWIDAGCPRTTGNGAGSGAGASPPKDGAPGRPTGAGTAGVMSYRDVQNLFASLNKDPGDAPHERFWELPYREFVEGVFPWSWDDPEITLRFVIPWDSRGSNLIKALRDGRSIEVQLPDGRTVRRNIKQMPKGATPVPEADIQRLADWIDAGCPEEPGKPSPWPRPGSGAAGPADEPPQGGDDAKGESPKEGAAKDASAKGAEAKGEDAKDASAKGAEAKGEDAKGEDAKGEDGQETDAGDGMAAGGPPRNPAAEASRSEIGFEEVVAIFKRLRQKAPNAPHSNFWRELSWGEFVTFEFPEGPGKEGRIRLLVPYDSAASNLIKALRDGKGLRVRYPDGRVGKRDIAPMPKDADAMPAADIARLAAWIDAGCPEHAGEPTTLPRGGVAAEGNAAGVAPVPAPAPAAGSGFPPPVDR